MMLKRYLENFLHLASDQLFGQDAVQWAVEAGRFELTYDLQTDLEKLHGPQAVVSRDPKTPTEYDRLVQEYRKWLADKEDRHQYEMDLLFSHVTNQIQQAA